MSGLASLGQRSAFIMVPGFVVLAFAQGVLATPSRTLRRLARACAITTFVAGVVRVSDPRCPQPGVDPGATASDIGHGAASIATFVLLASMPVAAARDHDLSPSLRRVARFAIAPTMATFALAGTTTRLDSPAKGAAQRAFLACAFLFLAFTGLAGGNGGGGTRQTPAPTARRREAP